MSRSETHGPGYGSLQMQVRLGGEADMERFISLCRLAHEESVFSALPFDAERLRRNVLAGMAQPDTYAAFHAELNGESVGMLVAMVQEYMFSPARAATALLFFVRPEARGGPAALLLLQAFGRWAVQRGAEELLIHVTSGVNLRQTDRFLRRVGFRQTGGNYARSLRPRPPT